MHGFAQELMAFDRETRHDQPNSHSCLLLLVNAAGKTIYAYVRLPSQLYVKYEIRFDLLVLLELMVS